MRRSLKYAFYYSLYWGVLFSFELTSFVGYGGWGKSNCDKGEFSNASEIMTVISYILSYRGIYSLYVIIAVNDLTLKDVLSVFPNVLLSRHKTSLDSTNSTQDDDVAYAEAKKTEPHLNVALRAEILYFTTLGIMHAARDYERKLQLFLANSRLGEANFHTSSSIISNATSFSSGQEKIEEISTTFKDIVRLR